jgi:hypothetical protein
VSRVFFSVLCCGVRLSPLGTSATNWPIVPAPDKRRVWISLLNENWRGNRSTRRKLAPLPIYNLFII